MTATEEETASAPIPILLQTRIRGVAPENAPAIGLPPSVTFTSRWGSWQIYDRTPVGRLVGLDYFGARYFSGAQGRFTSPDVPFADQNVEDPQSWNLYHYVRNNPLRYTDPTGRACFDGRGAASCGNYILGGLKAVGNIPSDIVNAPNRLTNALISPFTSFRFPDAIPQTFTASNIDQQQGIEAAQIVMIVAPMAEAGAAKAVEAIGAGTKAEAAAAATATAGQQSFNPFKGEDSGAS